MEAGEAAPVFRAGKRRKLTPRTRETAETENVADGSDPSMALLKRPKKHGINFTTAQPATLSGETAVAIATPVVPPDQHNDRFVKSAGKVVVIEDKQMLAFIDAKLADMGQVATSEDENHHKLVVTFDDCAEGQPFQVSGEQKIKIQAIPLVKTSKRRQRRRPAPPTQADLDRNSMVDRLMQEGAMPIYEQKELVTLQAPTSSGDNDAAAAAAFKAQFLASLEDKRSARKAAVTVSSGPKLGGGRMVQRMKAAEQRTKP